MGTGPHPCAPRGRRAAKGQVPRGGDGDAKSRGAGSPFGVRLRAHISSPRAFPTGSGVGGSGRSWIDARFTLDRQVVLIWCHGVRWSPKKDREWGLPGTTQAPQACPPPRDALTRVFLGCGVEPGPWQRASCALRFASRVPGNSGASPRRDMTQAAGPEPAHLVTNLLRALRRCSVVPHLTRNRTSGGEKSDPSGGGP